MWNKLRGRHEEPEPLPQLKGSAAKRLITLERIHTRLLEYLYEANALAIALKGNALGNDNSLALAYYQSSIDILIDIDNILEGRNIKTPRQVVREARQQYRQQQKAIEEADGEGEGGDSEHKEEEQQKTDYDPSVG